MADPKSYRPVSLTCCLCRIFEKCLLPYIKQYISPKMSSHQHGFVQQKSTQSNLLDTYEIVTKLKNTFSGNIDCIFLDFSKAFDKLNIRTLLNKLKNFNIPSRILRILNVFLTNRKQYVHVNGVDSKQRIVTSGVPQGTVLGPILFTIYINDLLQQNFENFIIAYADDIKIVGSSGVSLQKDLDKVIAWCSENAMILNKDKCVVLRFGQKDDNFQYKIQNISLKFSECEKDLGVFIDTKLSFQTHINHIRQKCFF